MNLVADFKKFAKKRARELGALATADLTAHEAKVEVAGQEIHFRINVERQAAWKLYVELSTRVATQPLAEHGRLREALDSFYELFALTREILKEAGPGVALDEESLGFYAMEILNAVIRPVLTKWHPALSHWEGQRDPKTSSIEHEEKWPQARAARRELESTRKTLVRYCDALGTLAGLSLRSKK